MGDYRGRMKSLLEWQIFSDSPYHRGDHAKFISIIGAKLVKIV